MTQIEDWLRQSYGLCDDKLLRDQLEPLVHASQLLQLKKQDEKDADEICNMCTSLNHLQVTCIVVIIMRSKLPILFGPLVKFLLVKQNQKTPC